MPYSRTRAAAVIAYSVMPARPHSIEESSWKHGVNTAHAANSQAQRISSPKRTPSIEPPFAKARATLHIFLEATPQRWSDHHTTQSRNDNSSALRYESEATPFAPRAGGQSPSPSPLRRANQSASSTATCIGVGAPSLAQPTNDRRCATELAPGGEAPRPSGVSGEAPPQ